MIGENIWSGIAVAVLLLLDVESLDVVVCCCCCWFVWLVGCYFCCRLFGCCFCFCCFCLVALLLLLLLLLVGRCCSWIAVVVVAVVDFADAVCLFG